MPSVDDITSFESSTSWRKIS